MSLLHFGALIVIVSLLSMRALRFNQKYLNFCCGDERRSYGFGTTWGWVINDRTFILGWTIPLSSISANNISMWICVYLLIITVFPSFISLKRTDNWQIAFSENEAVTYVFVLEMWYAWNSDKFDWRLFWIILCKAFLWAAEGCEVRPHSLTSDRRTMFSSSRSLSFFCSESRGR